MWKKFLSLLLCAVCLCSLTCCGKEESTRQVFMGKILISIPESWQERMGMDQMTYTFKSGGEIVCTLLTVPTAAGQTEPDKFVNTFDSQPSITPAEGYTNPFLKISGKDKNGNDCTEYHLIVGNIDHGFSFAGSVPQKRIDAVLNSVSQ